MEDWSAENSELGAKLDSMRDKFKMNNITNGKNMNQWLRNAETKFEMTKHVFFSSGRISWLRGEEANCVDEIDFTLLLQNYKRMKNIFL